MLKKKPTLKNRNTELDLIEKSIKLKDGKYRLDFGEYGSCGHITVYQLTKDTEGQNYYEQTHSFTTDNVPTIRSSTKGIFLLLKDLYFSE